MTHLFINIKELVQVREASVKKVSGKEMDILPTIKNAFLIIKDGLIFDFGEMSNLEESNFDKKTDCTGKMILPTWCDSHTHIVYAGNKRTRICR
jgi:imidazolonepropionase